MLNISKRILNALRASMVKMPPASDNVGHNRALWNRYAMKWNKDRIGVQQRETEDEAAFRDTITHLGDEWGSPLHVDEVLETFLYPLLAKDKTALEIGVGGGRIANKTSPLSKRLICCDISSEMLVHARTNLEMYDNIDFELLGAAGLPVGDASVDVVYSFDVFVHLDLHMIWAYFKEIARVLKSGGSAFLHVSNLRAPGGWDAFAAQEAFTVEGHYFITPDTIALFCEKSGLKLTKASEPTEENFYLHRDYLFVLEKP